MRIKSFLPVFLLLLMIGCTVGTEHVIRLRGNVYPSRIALDSTEPVTIEASIENIGNSSHTVTVSAEDNTQGINIIMPERTVFTLKPGESRVVLFEGHLDEAAAPGRYRIDVLAKTDSLDLVEEVVFLEVSLEKGLL